MENNQKPAVSKGKVSVVLDGGAAVTVKPYTGDVVTAKLVVPFFLFGSLTVGMEVVYAMFDDNTGVVLCRMDGEWSHEIKGDVNVEGSAAAGGISFNSHTHETPAGTSGGPN